MARIRTLKNIDPEMARGLLANKAESVNSSETIDEKRLHAIAHQMKKGRFDPYGICIELDQRGRLLEGAIYLTAIEESGTTVRMWVAEQQ